MSEGLSPEDARIAKDLRDKDYLLGNSKAEYARREVDYNARRDAELPAQSPEQQAVRDEETRGYEQLLKDGEQQRDAALWRGHQHKEKHLDQYIEAAKGEMEAKGPDYKYDDASGSSEQAPGETQQ